MVKYQENSSTINGPALGRAIFRKRINPREEFPESVEYELKVSYFCGPYRYFIPATTDVRCIFSIFLMNFVFRFGYDGVTYKSSDLYFSQKWREKWGIDTTLQTWEAPEVLIKHFPSGSTGFDKEGSPVIIVPFVGLDVWGLLHSVTKTDLIRMILRHLENYLASARKQAEQHGPAALKVTVIFDLEGFNIKQYAWKPAAEMVFSLLQLYEANYPEILKICYIVNAPKVFSLAFSVIKKFMHEYTISKIKIFSSDTKKWQPQVLTMVDPEQLPQHYGGTMVDENGDPRCSLMVKPGGKVPKSYYSSNQTFDSEKEFKRVTIKTGEKHVIDLLCSDNDSVLKWECGVDHHDIKFSITRRDEEGNETIVLGPRKITEGPTDVGVMAVNGPATYSIIFDNKNAFLRNKKIFYDIFISVPTRDLNINDDPTDELQPAAACSNTTTKS